MQIRPIVAAALLAAPAALQAQAAAPATLFARSPWAAEAGAGGGPSVSLLHVAPNGGAWVFSLVGSVQHISNSVDAFGQTQTQTTTGGQVALLVGRRHYSRDASLRPFVGGGVMANYGGLGSNHVRGAGIYGELGASYFLAPHFSVGVSDMLQLTYNRQWYGGGAPQHLDTSALALGTPTVRVTVFF